MSSFRCFSILKLYSKYFYVRIRPHCGLALPPGIMILSKLILKVYLQMLSQNLQIFWLSRCSTYHQLNQDVITLELRQTLFCNIWIIALNFNLILKDETREVPQGMWYGFVSALQIDYSPTGSVSSLDA